ncbi:MAG: YihY family inner membrane protein [Janthinobacterium lividum]
MAKFPQNLDALRRLARFAYQRIAEDRIAQVAGSLTFITVLSVVPLVAVAFAVLTSFPIFDSFRAALQDFLTQRLMPPAVNNQIFAYLNEFAAKARGLTTAGLLFLLATSLTTMMTIESTLNVIWRVRKPRPLAQRLLVYWGILTLGPVLFGVSLSASSYLLARSASTMSVAWSDLPMMSSWLLSAAVVPITALGYTLIYLYMPNCRVEWRDALAGGVLAAVAFELAKRGFGLYVRHMPTYTAVYGAFAVIPLFLLWVYLSWFITLVGATVTAALPLIRLGQHHHPRFAGSDLLDAIVLLARLYQAREDGRIGHTAFGLARRLRREIGETTQLLARFEERKWVARLQEERRAQRWILVTSPRNISLMALSEMFVLDRKELQYQLGMETGRLEGERLLGALENDKLSLTLAELIEIEREARAQGLATGDDPGFAAPAPASPRRNRFPRRGEV